jgi:N,N'-diacetyllegionaminate synthase
MNLNDLKSVFIIAEAGINHGGSLKEGLRLIDIAFECKADAIKFQTFKPSEIASKYVENVDYIKKNTEKSNIEILTELSLSYKKFRVLKDYADQKGIFFMSTPDGLDSLNFLTDDLNLSLIKIGSTEITNLNFLIEIGRKNQSCILSTGLSTLNEVEEAYSVLKNTSKRDIYVLQCTSDYPAKDDEINLRAMLTIKDKLGCGVGLSDHSIGSEAAVAAVALGAKIIEKHITRDKNQEGPDHKASMNPEEFAQYVQSIRKTEKILGDGIKKPTDSELKNVSGIRRGVVASKKLKKNTVIKKEHLDFKRPFVGINPKSSQEMIGRKLKVNLDKDQPIIWQYFEN